MVARPPASVFTAGLVLQSRYRLDELSAAGGAAEVWKGHDLVLRRAVAIKLRHTRSTENATIVERFRREAISAAKLTHPRIVPTYDTGAEGDTAFIVLGLVEGPTLAKVLQQRSFSAIEAVRIARQIVDALDHAHCSGLIHRDIKPSNILLVEGQHVMIAGFGIGEAIGDAMALALTAPGFVVGTPDCVAPEQAMDTTPDARTDIYAVGVLLHKMICRHGSFDEPTHAIAIDNLSADKLCDHIPNPLRPVIEQATEVDPHHRFQTAADLDLALMEAEKYLLPATSLHIDYRRSQLDPSTSTPTSKEPRIRSRHRSLAVMAVFAALVVTAIGAGRTVAELASRATDNPATAAPAIVSITAAHSFDPFGIDKAENETQADNTIDGNIETGWSTETYATRKFGNLKPGVGLLLSTDKTAKLSGLSIASSSRNWSASIYLAPESVIPSTLEAWGSPIDNKQAISGDVDFDLHQTDGISVLVWITDLGDGNRVTVSEARLTS